MTLDMPVLSVIIVSYNVRHYVRQCLDSVLRSCPDAELFVVDNASSDGSAEYIRDCFPQAVIIANTENVGFGRANNQALAQASGRYVLFLNPDTVVAERTLPGCIAYMDSHPGTGAVGVRMQYGDGRFAMESRRSVPTPSVSFWHMTGMGRLFPRSRKFAKYHLSYMDRDSECPIEVVSGAFMFVRKEALDRTGGFDESFFMYGEDIDLSYRILQAGYENCYLPLPIVHYKGESTNKTSYRYAKVFYDAMTIFFDKHYRHYNGFFRLMVKLVAGVRKIVTFLGQNILKGRRQIAECREKCLFVGRRECFDDVAALVARSSHLTGLQYAGSPETADLSGIEAILFDTDTFSYDRILDLMYGYACGGRLMTMGLYSQKTGHLITIDEVL